MRSESTDTLFQNHLKSARVGIFSRKDFFENSSHRQFLRNYSPIASPLEILTKHVFLVCPPSGAISEKLNLALIRSVCRSMVKLMDGIDVDVCFFLASEINESSSEFVCVLCELFQEEFDLLARM